MTEPLDDAREKSRDCYHIEACPHFVAVILRAQWAEAELAKLRSAPVPQCEAEPVAWQIIGADGSPSSVTREPDLVKSWNENCYKYRPLYAAPPSRSDAGTVAVTSTLRETPDAS